MPGVVEQEAPPAHVAQGFSVSHQKVHLNIDLFSRRIEGHTEIEIIPHSADLKHVRLNSRQAKITQLKFSPRGVVSTPFSHSDPYALLQIPYETTADQYHLIQDRLEKHLGFPPPTNLEITIPRTVKIVEQGSTIYLNGAGKVETGADGTRFMPIKIYIDFVIETVRDGLHFVGWDSDDLRYPHVYTQNAASGAIACLFPCMDSLDSRCTWDISIKTSKTIGDALQLCSREKENAEAKLQTMSAEDKALDLIVTCSGDMTDEIVDPQDPTKKTTSFKCDSPVSARHVGFAIGPFEEVNLAAFRESDEDDRLGRNAVPLHAFCLPGRGAEVRNTCFPLAKAMDAFVTEYGQFPFASFKLCFVDEMLIDHYETASLSICCNRMLFSEEIIDPLYKMTRELVFALASQWSGVHITPSQQSDLWATIGIAYFMTDTFLRKLFGNNEYRFQQKIASQRICELDIGLPSIHNSGLYVSLDRFYYDFIALKAPVVLFILDRRLIKANASNGVSRIIAKAFRDAKIGENETLSTGQFLRICEKSGHIKLENFFDQWVYGVGCPKFRITQRFNKKRLVVEMSIVQEQGLLREDKDIEPSTFMREIKEHSMKVYAPEPQACFTGPMTIRIHEADGTPYEHIVEIKDANMKVDIPYNTKYKRLKRSRRQRERVATGALEDPTAEASEDMLLYCLGDILGTDEEKQEWRLVDWSKEDQDKMNQESYEWIRMDADFEWICQLSINMPGYMFVSQLQQDRDVVAQLETIQFLASQRTHPLIPTFLVRTLLDNRYFHGIRTEAALALKSHAIGNDGGLGFFHLQKSFQELFCLGNSSMTKPNDFSDRASYYVQNAIPCAIAGIRDAAGRSPFVARKFLYETLRYNDNGDNEVSSPLDVGRYS
jgi:transcription initiation factor TFIID subunit 2